ncbi:hypothetical protein HK101_007984 [Irineochytrium annulatum]|nr:hypothetical protein HK101_007984 [Irineochytrium annulatum]
MEGSNMTHVVAALMEQARTIRLLQQAVADLEVAKRSHSPTSFGEIKRSLATKSSCADVEDLRVKVKMLEEQLAQTDMHAGRERTAHGPKFSVDMNGRNVSNLDRMATKLTPGPQQPNYNSKESHYGSEKFSFSGKEDTSREKVLYESRLKALEEALVDMQQASKSLGLRVLDVERTAGKLEDEMAKFAQSKESLRSRLDYHVLSVEALRKSLPKGDTPSSNVATLTDIDIRLHELRTNMNRKVETQTLEKLMPFLATREDLKQAMKAAKSFKEGKPKDEILPELLQMLQKHWDKQQDFIRQEVKSVMLSQEFMRRQDSGHDVTASSNAVRMHEALFKKTNAFMKELNNRLQSLESQLASNGQKGDWRALKDRMKKLEDAFVSGKDRESWRGMLNDTSDERNLPPEMPSTDGYALMHDKLSREFDEKLFLLCSDLSACKAAFQNAASQPFYRCGQWLWRSSTLKQGSAVPWNYETTNTDSENFFWEQDQPFIKVTEPGLYEITFAFFTKCRPSVQLIINGESVISAINAPSFVVHHSSGLISDGNGHIEEGTITGLSLMVAFYSLSKLITF